MAPVFNFHIVYRIIRYVKSKKNNNEALRMSENPHFLIQTDCENLRAKLKEGSLKSFNEWHHLMISMVLEI